MLETAGLWEQEGRAGGEVREIIGAVDATFLERLMLIFADLPTGSLVLEEVADDRPYATWKAWVDERLTALRTGGLSLVSDRAQALIQRAEKGLGCLSMPDVFPLMHDIGKRDSLAMARQLRHAQRALKTAEDALARHPELTPADHDGPAAQATVEARRAAVQRWEEVRSASRHHLEALSLSRHPCGLLDATPQTSAQVESRVQAAVQASET